VFRVREEVLKVEGSRLKAIQEGVMGQGRRKRVSGFREVSIFHAPVSNFQFQL
jgi:hypothetical protein